jgi:tripartite-type tricarboxylate transporter receptor subunit TctC
MRRAVVTPSALIFVDRLNRELRQILAEEDVKQRLAAARGVPAPMAHEAMRDCIEREIARWRHVVQARGIERQ